MNLSFIKTYTGQPAIFGSEAQEEWDKLKTNTVVKEGKGGFKKVRNPLFHRKYFALLNFAFEYWEPTEIDCKYGKPEKNFDQFRKDIIILAGYYVVVYRLDGSFRIEPKSISFAKMEQDEFEELYSKSIDVIINKILVGMDPKELNDLVNRTLEFV